MTLQEIADYAMRYLDSKGVAAEYDVYEVEKPLPGTVFISTDNNDICLPWLPLNDDLDAYKKELNHILDYLTQAN